MVTLPSEASEASHAHSAEDDSMHYHHAACLPSVQVSQAAGVSEMAARVPVGSAAASSPWKHLNASSAGPTGKRKQTYPSITEEFT